MPGPIRLGNCNGEILNLPPSNNWRTSLVNFSQMSKKRKAGTDERVHNKSGCQELAILRANTDEELAELERTLKPKLVPGPEVIEGSRCKLWPNKKLKITRAGKVYLGGLRVWGLIHCCQDVGESYHVRAVQVFGRDRMRLVPANKDAGSLTVSHICGSRRCCKRSHLLLEPKHINDGRTHCHFLPHVLHSQRRDGEIKAMVKAIRKACPHTPLCFSSLRTKAVSKRVIEQAPMIDVFGM